MFEEAKSDALHALDVFEELEAAGRAEATGRLLELIDNDAQRDGLGSDGGWDDDGGLLETTPVFVCTNSCSDRITESE